MFIQHGCNKLNTLNVGFLNTVQYVANCNTLKTLNLGYYCTVQYNISYSVFTMLLIIILNIVGIVGVRH